MFNDELRRTVAASNSHEDAVARCDDAVQAMLALLGAPERQADSQAQSTASGRRR